MPVRIRICLLVVLLTVGFTSGCGQSTRIRHGSGPLRIDHRFNGGRIEMQVGQTVFVSMPSNTVGYEWLVVENPTDLLRHEGETDYYLLDPAETRFGDTVGFDTFRFVTMAPGETTIELWSRHPDKPDELPANTFTVNVDINAE